MCAKVTPLHTAASASPGYRQRASATRGCTLQRRLCTPATVFWEEMRRHRPKL